MGAERTKGKNLMAVIRDGNRGSSFWVWNGREEEEAAHTLQGKRDQQTFSSTSVANKSMQLMGS